MAKRKNKKIKYRQNDIEVLTKILNDAMSSESFKQTYNDIESQQIFFTAVINYVSNLIKHYSFIGFIDCCNEVKNNDDLFDFINLCLATEIDSIINLI